MSVSQTDRVEVDGSEPPPRPARRRQFSPVVLVLALVFFFTPAVALAGGFHAHQIENRPLAKFPSIHDGWKALPELGTWATDHLFGRKQAVAANNQIAQHLFGQLPDDTGSATKPGGYPAVIQGTDGWLFLGDDMKTRCTTHAVPATVVAKLNRLSSIIRSSGRKFVLMIAPDKSSVYPQYLPKAYLGRSCAPAYTAAFWKAFDAHPPIGNVDIRTPLLQQAKTSPVPLYRPLDSHWDMEGISIEAQLMANALDPRLANGTHVADQGTYHPIGDLTYLLGQPRADSLPDQPHHQHQHRRPALPAQDADPRRLVHRHVQAVHRAVLRRPDDDAQPVQRPADGERDDRSQHDHLPGGRADRHHRLQRAAHRQRAEHPRQGVGRPPGLEVAG